VLVSTSTTTVREILDEPARHVSVKVLPAVSAEVRSEPLSGFLPLQAPLASQDLAPAEAHDNRTGEPELTAVRSAAKDRVRVSPREPPPPPAFSPLAAQAQAQVVESSTTHNKCLAFMAFSPVAATNPLAAVFHSRDAMNVTALALLEIRDVPVYSLCHRPAADPWPAARNLRGT